MFNFLRKKKSKYANALYFKSGEAFFEYHCKYMVTTIKENHAAVALVLDARKELGAESAVDIIKNGIQAATIQVASDDGGFLVRAETLSSEGEKLQPGDVVLWVPHILFPEVGIRNQSRQRPGWLGFIRAKINPVIFLDSPSFDVVCRFD